MNSGTPGAGVAGAAGPGRGAVALGAGAGRGPGAGGAGRSAAGGLGAAGRGGPGRAACAGVFWPPVGPGVAEGADGIGGRGVAFLGAEGLAPDLPEPPPWNASVSLRTTGASIVEDAERTNSPSSWSLAMTTLLSTPNSLASSYTRTLATSLL